MLMTNEEILDLEHILVMAQIDAARAAAELNATLAAETLLFGYFRATDYLMRTEPPSPFPASLRALLINVETGLAGFTAVLSQDDQTRIQVRSQAIQQLIATRQRSSRSNEEFLDRVSASNRAAEEFLRRRAPRERATDIDEPEEVSFRYHPQSKEPKLNIGMKQAEQDYLNQLRVLQQTIVSATALLREDREVPASEALSIEEQRKQNRACNAALNEAEHVVAELYKQLPIIGDGQHDHLGLMPQKYAHSPKGIRLKDKKTGQPYLVDDEALLVRLAAWFKKCYF